MIGCSSTNVSNVRAVFPSLSIILSRFFLNTRGLKYGTETGSIEDITLKKTHTWLNEPCHDKTNKVGFRPAWIQTSLRICAV
jgi:hypothetical protein